MKKLFLIIFIVMGFAWSCSDPLKEHYEALDRAIEMKPFYEQMFQQRQDSLSQLLNTASTESARWETAYALQSMMIYNDVDESDHYIKTMRANCGADKELTSITQRCYVNYLFRKGQLDSAYAIFRKIDPTPLSRDELNLYYDVGCRILNEISPKQEEHKELQNEIMQAWKANDSTYCRYLHYYYRSINNPSGPYEAVRRFKSCEMKNLNDTAKVNDLIATEYRISGDITNAKKYYAIAAECDMRLSAKTYNALYKLAQLLFKEGDIERANHYMRVTRKDALASNYSIRYQNVFMNEIEITNALLHEQKRKKTAYLYATTVTVLMLVMLVFMLVLLQRYSNKLKFSLENLGVLSGIKDSFLATYMERCVDYLNKVDEYRSTLRKTVKAEGAEAVIIMLKQPSFADKEFKNLLSDFDTAFLGIFPDFVEKVNKHMQPEHRLTMPSEGELSTELRILALIRLGITKRPKIAKVLNMSVNTVYSYHCNLHKHSLHPELPLDEVIGNL